MKCLVASCKNKGRHKIPQNEDLKKQWIEAIKHIKPGRTINARTTICSDHFLKTDFSVIPSYWNNFYMGRKKLKKTVVPSVFPWTTNKPVEEPSPITIQDTVTFNADKVKATYSRDKPTVHINKQSYTKMKMQCIIPNCENKGRHKFPKDEARRKQWMQAIKHLKPKITINSNSLICSDHFRLSVFPWNESVVEVTLEQPSGPDQVKLKQPSSPIQIKLEQPSSPHQVKLEPSSITTIQVKVEPPSSPVHVKLERQSSPVQVKLEPPSSPVQIKIERPSSPIQDEIEQQSSPTQFEEQQPSSIQDTFSFNPGQVNVTSFKEYPKQSYMVSKQTRELRRRFRCIVAHCENRGRHKLPKDENRRKQWIKAIKHIKPGMIPSYNSIICSDHFQKTDFSVVPTYWNNYYSGKILKKNVVPSVFPWNKTVEVQQDQQPSLQDTIRFNPNIVKATYTRVLPTEFVEEQKNVVSTFTEDSFEDPLQ